MASRQRIDEMDGRHPQRPRGDDILNEIVHEERLGGFGASRARAM